METLTRLPWIGPLAAWFFRTRVWHVYEHLDARNWSRLAAAITFTSFVTLFPVLGLVGAIGAALLTDGQLDTVENWVTDQVPGISRELHVRSLFENAGTIGIISLALVLPTGASWVDALRGCLRAVWDLPDPEDNMFLRRGKDIGVLAGLGVVVLVSLAASGLALSGVRQLAQFGPGAVLIQVAAYAGAMGVTFLLLSYVLVWLPGVRPPRRAVIVACVIGAVGFEVLKLLISGYLTEVATRSVYGAFGVPIALLVWINLMAKLLLVCCAWTATAVTPQDRPCADALEDPPADECGGTDTPPPPPPPDHRPPPSGP
ncbi:YihY/virulence factor BrkB family protein [Streptomyces avicenniae]|uniref:YihY/virulence factor BrkB family protein n=1 Tax=Streptomyces avicenniae TaxID=500153 RepID=UPI000DA62398